MATKSRLFFLFFHFSSIFHTFIFILVKINFHNFDVDKRIFHAHLTYLSQHYIFKQKNRTYNKKIQKYDDIL